MAFQHEETALDGKIKDLLSEALAPGELGPDFYLVGDGESWFKQAGRDFDRARRANAIRELRHLIWQKIEQCESEVCDSATLELMGELKGEIWQSEKVLLQTAWLFSTKPDQLFEHLRNVLNSAPKSSNKL